MTNLDCFVHLKKTKIFFQEHISEFLIGKVLEWHFQDQFYYKINYRQKNIFCLKDY